MKKTPVLLWVLHRVRRRLPALVVMTVSHILQALLGVVFALGTRQIIDCAVAGDGAEFWNACVGQAVVICLILLCLTLFRHLKDKLRADLDRDWKKDLLHGLMHGDFADVSAYHSGELLNRLNNDVRTVDDGLLNVFPNVMAMLARLIASMAVLVALEPWFALAVLAAGLVVVVITGLMRSRLKGLHKQVSQHDGIVSGFLQESLEKLLMVQAMDVSEEIERRADGLLDQRYVLQRKRKNVSLCANTGVSLLSYGAGFFALVWCSDLLLKGQISFGSLTAVTQLVSQLQTPFVGLSGVIPQYISMIASAERLQELEAIQGQCEPAVNSCDALYRRMDRIAGKGICFSYDRDTVLEDASFSIPKGAFAVVTGPSGIGKSTLLRLLLGISAPECGGLYVECGEKKVALNRSTRRLFAYVPQGNLLFSGTLRENLLLTNPNATEEQLQMAIHVSAVAEFLPQLPKGLDTLLGENAMGLSEGQAQRLSIARALLSGAPILLLDECTSALDAQTERLVLQRLRELPDRTFIAVTHRTAALDLCDWKLELKDGKIDSFPLN